MKLGPYALGPNDTPENGIYTGDAREMSKAIPDESVDLIFTDPVYQNIDDYRWLAETGARVLKEGGACLAWASNVHQYDSHAAMIDYLRWVAPLIWTYVGKPHRLIAYNLFVWSTPLLWFDKGASYPRRRTIDTVITSGRPLGGHKWNKNPACYLRWMDDFTTSEALIFDPFTGGGTVPAVCKMLGRKYLAFEILPDIAESARRRVRETQPPLFIPEPIQTELSL